MGPINFALIGLGLALMVIGYFRMRGPWARYQELRDEEANEARYNAWRGGARDTGPTGASVARELYRRQAQQASYIAIAGIVPVVLGFLAK